MKLLLFVLCYFVIFFKSLLILCHPSKNVESLKYLYNYGYFEESNNKTLHELHIMLKNSTELENAIVSFQEFNHLTVDGKLNEETIKEMKLPRCGIEDNPLALRKNLLKWEKKTTLNWHFYLGSKTHRNIAKKAFEIWSDHINLNFEMKPTDPNIIISFGNLDHFCYKKNCGNKCSFSFDGPGHILGHAFYPQSNENTLEIHLDSDENWDLENNENYLLSVLAHEIGHVLGIPHLHDQNAIMFSHHFENKLKLNPSDIYEAELRYGKKHKTEKTTLTTRAATTTSTTTVTTTSTTTTEPVKKTTIFPKILNNNDKLNEPNLCDIPDLNTFLIINNKLFIFYKKWVWIKKLKENTFNLKPELITNWVSFLPNDFSHLNAIYQQYNGHLVVFDNVKKYIVQYPSFKLLYSYPNSRNITSALVTYTGRTFLFHKEYCSEIELCSPHLTKSTTLTDETFPGIPSNIDGAFRYNNGLLYFFKNNKYYEYDEFNNQLIRAGDFKLSLFNINCPNTNILNQIKNLLEKIYI